MFSTSVSTENLSRKATHAADPHMIEAGVARFLSLAISSPLKMTDDQPGDLQELVHQVPESWQSEVRKLADAWKLALTDRESLAVAYAQLFLGPFEIHAPPYASFYLEPDQKLMGQVSNEVAAAYTAAGLSPGPGPREAPDHVALEWEFIYFLTHQAVVTDDTDWLRVRQTFIESHLMQWMPALCKAIRDAAVHPFYNRWADASISLLSVLSRS